LVSFYFGPKDKAQGAAHHFNTNERPMLPGRSLYRPPARQLRFALRCFAAQERP
jgi:hypothetical protein